MLVLLTIVFSNFGFNVLQAEPTRRNTWKTNFMFLADWQQSPASVTCMHEDWFGAIYSLCSRFCRPTCSIQFERQYFFFPFLLELFFPFNQNALTWTNKDEYTATRTPGLICPNRVDQSIDGATVLVLECLPFNWLFTSFLFVSTALLCERPSKQPFGRRRCGLTLSSDIWRLWPDHHHYHLRHRFTGCVDWCHFN